RLPREHLTLLRVGEQQIDAEVSGKGDERLGAQLLDHLERAGIERQGGTCLLGDGGSPPGSSTWRIAEERPAVKVEVIGAAQHRDRQLRRPQVVVCALARNHRPLTVMIDPHSYRTSQVGVRYQPVSLDTLGFQLFTRQDPEAVVADLANEAGRLAAALRPYSGVSRAATRRQLHLTEDVAA